MVLSKTLGRFYTQKILNNFSNLRGITRLYLIIRNAIKKRNIVETEFNNTNLFVPLMANQGLSIYLGRNMGESEFLEKIEESLGPNDVFVDVGASFGLASRVIKNRTDNRVIAFEPNPINYSILSLNNSSYKSEFETFNKALGSKQEKLEISFQYGRSHLKEENNKSDQKFIADVVTLDSQIEKADVVKIDVEGFELEVLKGMTNLIKSNKPILFIELHADSFLDRYGTSQKEVIDWLEDHGYQIDKNPDGNRKHIKCKPSIEL